MIRQKEKEEEEKEEEVEEEKEEEEERGGRRHLSSYRNQSSRIRNSLLTSPLLLLKTVNKVTPASRDK